MFHLASYAQFRVVVTADNRSLTFKIPYTSFFVQFKTVFRILNASTAFIAYAKTKTMTKTRSHILKLKMNGHFCLSRSVADRKMAFFNTSPSILPYTGQEADKKRLL